MTTGEQLVSLSGLSAVSALTHLLGITAGGDENSGAGGGGMRQPVIEYRDRVVEVPVTYYDERIVEKIVEKPVDRVVEVFILKPAEIPGLPPGTKPRVQLIDGVPILEASRPLIEARDAEIIRRDTRIAALTEHGDHQEAEARRLAGEVESLTALLMAVAE